MRKVQNAGFFRLFLGGFAIGAVGLVAVQSVHADEHPTPAPTHSEIQLIR
ncbi:hypothetical protein [Stakelama marina]|uniref:Uncharacterized protein n=1 Tax=Stakelama marina TaxID=2826939 RepID=A0A8T4IGF2_9SPHN|nr:hypothetical protein [Stakelama marina]MBR0552954.1 hypothetical protein [Stakelama marina]